MDAIAVVGLGCVLPNALRVSDFWNSITAGRVSLSKVPARAWNHALHFHPDRSIPDKTHCELGGFVTDFVFDWRKYKVPPSDAQQVNPLQWMILEAGTQALSEVRNIPKESTAIILGATGLGWQRDSGMRIRLEDMLDAVRATPEFQALPASRQQELLDVTAQQLRARLKEVSEDNVVGASASVACGRINMHFDLKGLHYSVDAGFASSLASLDLAVRGLRDGEFDLAVAGGASEMLTPLEFIAFSKMGGLSTQGAIRPFSEQADGTLLGEGVAMFALKRLADAERDGDTIYALVRGVGGSSDGRGKSLVAPRSEGQALAMRRALEDAGVEPGSVQYVECHATGTQVGDASEVRALASVYTVAPGDSIALGSVKANIGHLRAGAGAAGLLKAVLSLHHGVIPPQPGVDQVNPKLEMERTPFFVPKKAQPYRPGTPARAAVSSFSFGGNNFHAVLEAYRPAERPQAPAVRARPKDEPLAIIGLGGIFPGASNVADFWKRLVEGYDATREIPKERWDVERYYGPDRKDKAYTKLGCFVDEFPKPSLEMRIPPAAWASLDPSHVLMLWCADEALQDAGFSPDKWNRDRVAMSFAFLPYQGKKFQADTRTHWSEFAHELGVALEKSGVPAATRDGVLRRAEERYKANLPPISEDSLTGYLGSLNAGRIANLYDFHGPHMVTDSACASAHAALHASWKMLQHREADVVLTGGVWCDMLPEFFIAACRFNALSAHGSSPFNEKADGFIPGEGAGVFVLKRLSDAERDGNRIHAVIRSVAGASDGKGRSVLAPSEAGEALAMKRALAAADVPSTSVDLVEAHGTGTALGDVTEARATHAAYSEGRDRPILIGSVKSNIGHLNAAAGTAGMMKVTLALKNAFIPQSLKCEPLNPKIPEGVEVVATPREWPQPPDGGPRRAGVSGFGVGGANFHAILEEYRPSPNKPAAVTEGSTSEGGDPRLVAVAGADARSCLAQLDRLCELPEPLEDTRQTPEGAFRMALTARSREELRKKRDFLRKAAQTGGDLEFLAQSGIFVGGPESPLRGAPVAITFPGQGGQYANMLRPLAQAYPVVARTLREADRLYEQLTGRTLTGSFFTDDPQGYQQRDEDIHAAVFLVNVALYRLLSAHGILAEYLIGQSAGELAALVAAGSLSLEEGLRAIHSRTLAVLEMPTEDPGQMAALSCPAEKVPELLVGLPGYATLAADNGPRACIVSADRHALPALVKRCEAQGIECTVLAVSHGYHSELIGDARPAYQRVLEGLRFRKPQACLVSTIDAAPYGNRPPSEYPAFLASQFVEPVRLRAAIEAAHQRGARIFIEAGPKWSLTQFTRETLKGKTHGAIASIHPKVGDMEQFKRLVGHAFVNGVGQLSPDEAGELTPSEVEELLLQMPLDGVLEPASAMKVALALGEEFGVDASGARLEDLRTFESIIALVERLRVEAPTPAALAAQALKQAPPPAPVAAHAPKPASAPARQPEAAAAPDIDPVALKEEIRVVLLDNVVAKTGYPEDMLDLDLDLEADLGIDTVKQVDIFSRTREHFGVPRDPNRSLREFNTLGKVIEHIVERTLALSAHAAPKAPAAAARPSAPPPPAPAPTPAPVAARPAAAAAIPPAPRPTAPAMTVSRPGAPAPRAEPRPAAPAPAPAAARPAAANLEDLSDQVRAVLLKNVVEKTGYPEDMLELDLDLEADLGIDTVKQVDIFSRTREYFGVPRDPNRSLREFNTLRKVIQHVVERVHSTSATERVAAAVHSAAVSVPPAQVESQGRSSQGSNGQAGQRSAREALLAMDLRQAGVKNEELRKLGEAMASRLGSAAPEANKVRTLQELLQHLVKDR